MNKNKEISRLQLVNEKLTAIIQSQIATAAQAKESYERQVLSLTETIIKLRDRKNERRKLKRQKQKAMQQTEKSYLTTFENLVMDE